MALFVTLLDSNRMSMLQLMVSVSTWDPCSRQQNNSGAKNLKKEAKARPGPEACEGMTCKGKSSSITLDIPREMDTCENPVCWADR